MSMSKFIWLHITADRFQGDLCDVNKNHPKKRDDQICHQCHLQQVEMSPKSCMGFVIDPCASLWNQVLRQKIWFCLLCLFQLI